MLRHARTEEGFAVGTAIHLVDTVLCLMGRPQRVEARHERAAAGTMLLDAALTFPGGASARLFIAPQCGADEETYEVIGPDYCVQADFRAARVHVSDGGEEAAAWSAPADAEAVWRDGSFGEAESFLAALKGEREFAPGLEDGVIDMLVAEAMEDGAARDLA